MTIPAKQQFEQHAADSFQIKFTEAEPLACRVEEVKTGLQPQTPEQNEQFSVVFACEDTQVYEQGVYAVAHDQLGEFELFLVPVFGDDKGVHYEAVFT